MTVPYGKLALSYADQVQLLVDRGLHVPDRAVAEEVLARIGYYRLSGYWHLFKQADNRFETGAAFSQAVDFYEFDRRLRLLVMDAIERVEIHLRTAITYTLGHDLGPFAHEDTHSFRHDFGDRNGHITHASWLADLHKEAQRSRETFVDTYRTKYDGFPALPIWMATEVMSFGTLSKLFQALKPDHQRAVVTPLGVHHAVARSWFGTLTYVRNLCAHHSRLWNRELSIHPSIPRNDSNFTGTHIANPRRSYAVLLVLRHLTRNHGCGDDWARATQGLLATWDGWRRWQRAMGMPEDWRGNPLWQLPGEPT